MITLPFLVHFILLGTGFNALKTIPDASEHNEMGLPMEVSLIIPLKLANSPLEWVFHGIR